MLSPIFSRGLTLIFWPVTAPEQPRSISMRKYSGIFPVVAAIFLIVVVATSTLAATYTVTINLDNGNFNSACDPSGNGEGQELIHTFTVPGNGAFTFVIPRTGGFITATSTPLI
jgi:hypothetical protein